MIEELFIVTSAQEGDSPGTPIRFAETVADARDIIYGLDYPCDIVRFQRVGTVARCDRDGGDRDGGSLPTEPAAA